VFSFFPPQVLTQVFYKALPKEKVKAQGFGRSVKAFMALRFNEASSSDYPPDKKVIPTQAEWIDLDKARTVLCPISSGEILFLSG